MAAGAQGAVPLTASAVASVRRGARPARTAAQLATTCRSIDCLPRLPRPGGPVHIVNVSKTRTRYHVQGCVSELTDVIANGKKVRTVAIEDADPAKVIAAVAPWGSTRYREHELPTWPETGDRRLELRQHRCDRQAVIDVGTNSVKFHVGERQADGTWTTVVDRAEVTRLGEGIEQTGAIAPRQWNEPPRRSPA